VETNAANVCDQNISKDGDLTDIDTAVDNIIVVKLVFFSSESWLFFILWE
jgi:hypothetical protein